MKHKWHKEIKAWADGAKIEYKYHRVNEWRDIDEPHEPQWNMDGFEYRIKPQPFLGMKEIPYKDWVLRFYKMPNDLWYTEGINDEWMNEMFESSKPQPAWNEEEFNAIAYAYRSCPAHEVKMVSERYQELVDYVLSAIKNAVI